ncbi:MAG: rod shape-determining protein MreC [Patescibacteria group bacterium]
MIFQIKHTKPNFFGGSFFKILLTIFFILILFFVFNTNWARSFVSNIFYPFLKTGDFFYGTIGQIPKYFYNKNELIKENTELSNKIENLYNNIADYESLKYENQKLRQELGLKPTGNFITTAVIAKPPQIPLDSLFLGKGTEGGINNGDFVLASERVLIGKIVKTSKNRATASLNSFAGVITYGFVARTDEPLEINGAGGGNIETKVPIDFDIIVGDKIMAGGSLNYLAAIVGNIEEDNPSGFKKILMSLPANISKINIVFVEPIIKQ